MTTALERPAVSGLFTHWTPQPLAIVLVVLLAVWYLRSVRRLDGEWPVGRTVTFFGGLAVLVYATCGFAQSYLGSVFWVWTAQTLVLWLFVPMIVLFGHPVQLARAVSGSGSRVDRVLRSRAVKVLGNPLVGPALVPILSAVLFFGPLPAWSIRWSVVGWVVHLALLAVGAIMAIPLVGLDEDASSLAVGLSLAIGAFELVLDAVPGIVLRLHRGLLTSYFDHRHVHAWTTSAPHDQQIAGAILWCIAELIDMPFLVLVYRRWLRADARDAARIDAVLEAERAARRGLDADTPTPDDPAVERDVPWWLSDPEMQERLRRQH